MAAFLAVVHRMCKRILSVDVCSWIVFTAITLVVSGCGPDATEILLTDEPQSGTFYIELSYPTDLVVDSSGDELHMPDGMQIVMETTTFEKHIQPLLSRRDKDSPEQLVRVDASFQLQKESVVIGVAQNEDGGGDERSRTYWVLKVEETRSADWYRLPQ